MRLLDRLPWRKRKRAEEVAAAAHRAANERHYCASFDARKSICQTIEIKQREKTGEIPQTNGHR